MYSDCLAPVPGANKGGDRCDSRGKVEARGQSQTEQTQAYTPQAVGEGDAEERYADRSGGENDGSFVCQPGGEKTGSQEGGKVSRSDQ